MQDHRQGYSPSFFSTFFTLLLFLLLSNPLYIPCIQHHNCGSSACTAIHWKFLLLYYYSFSKIQLPYPMASNAMHQLSTRKWETYGTGQVMLIVGVEQHGNMMILAKTSIYFVILLPILVTIRAVPIRITWKSKWSKSSCDVSKTHCNELDGMLLCIHIPHVVREALSAQIAILNAHHWCSQEDIVSW